MWIFYYGTTFSGQFWWDQKLNKNWCHSRLPVFENFTASCLFAYWHGFKDFTTSCLLSIFINKKWQLFVYFFFIAPNLACGLQVVLFDWVWNENGVALEPMNDLVKPNPLLYISAWICAKAVPFSFPIKNHIL